MKNLACNFGLESRKKGNPIEINGREVLKCEIFRYLRSIIQKNGDIRDDIDHRIKIV